MSENKYPPGFESAHPTVLFYRGPGIAATEHIQSHIFDFRCPKCESIEHVIVRLSEWGVQMHSGDARGVFRAECEQCGEKFSGGFED